MIEMNGNKRLFNKTKQVKINKRDVKIVSKSYKSRINRDKNKGKNRLKRRRKSPKDKDRDKTHTVNILLSPMILNKEQHVEQARSAHPSE